MTDGGPMSAYGKGCCPNRPQHALDRGRVPASKGSVIVRPVQVGIQKDFPLGRGPLPLLVWWNCSRRC